MKDALSTFFAVIYEDILGIRNTSFDLIFQFLWEYGGYISFGMIFILIPLVMWVLFYLVWRYPYGKIWHWLIWWGFISLVVGIVTWQVATVEIFESNWQPLNDALADPETGYYQYAETLPIKYALYNSLLCLVLGFIYSLILKQFSKLQIHLPF